MIKQSLLLFITLNISFLVIAQTEFKKGFFVDNQNQKTECLIEVRDWSSNPVKFTYKLTVEAEPQVHVLSTVKEFGVDGLTKFIRAKTRIDRSSDNIISLSRSRPPEWSEEEVFLRVVIEGKMSLYSYYDNEIRRFFYSEKDSIHQLIYKRYMNEGDDVLENATFRQQLWNSIKCSSTSEQSLQSIDYKLNDLEGYFRKYYECTQENYIAYAPRKKGDLFRMYVLPGINLSSATVTRETGNNTVADLGNSINPRLGVGFEIAFPAKKRTWSVIVEPTFQYYDDQITWPNGTVVRLKYSTLDFLGGIRHYFPVGKDFKIFLDGYYNLVSAVILNEFRYGTGQVGLNPGSYFGLGAGSEFKKIGVEIRYFTPRNLFKNNEEWSSECSAIAFIIGYRFF